MEIEGRLNLTPSSQIICDFISPEKEAALLNRYRIVVMIWNNYESTNELQFLMRKIRNSISHFRYEIHTNNILLKDVHNNKQVFRVSMPAHHLLNLTIDFIQIINEFLVSNKLIEK